MLPYTQTSIWWALFWAAKQNDVPVVTFWSLSNEKTAFTNRGYDSNLDGAGSIGFVFRPTKFGFSVIKHN